MVNCLEIIMAKWKEKIRVGYFLLSNGTFTLPWENSSGVTFMNVVGRATLGLKFYVNKCLVEFWCQLKILSGFEENHSTSCI
jgi:hypothetical protein